jgi:hypothetical protein
LTGLDEPRIERETFREIEIVSMNHGHDLAYSSSAKWLFALSCATVIDGHGIVGAI